MNTKLKIEERVQLNNKKDVAEFCKSFDDSEHPKYLTKYPPLHTHLSYVFNDNEYPIYCVSMEPWLWTFHPYGIKVISLKEFKIKYSKIYKIDLEKLGKKVEKIIISWGPKFKKEYDKWIQNL